MSLKTVPRQLWDFRRGMATVRVLCQLGQDHGLPLADVLRHTGLSQLWLRRIEGDGGTGAVAVR